MSKRIQYDLGSLSVYDKELIEKIRLKLFFLDYLINNGFDKKEIRNILEISDRVEDSLSILLPKDRYTPFVVAPEIVPGTLEKYNINGLEGCIFNGELHSGSWNDNPNEKSKVLDSKGLLCFDASVAMGLSNIKRCAMYTIKGMPKFFGDCVVYKNSEHKKFVDACHRDSVSLMNEQSDVEYKLLTDTVESEGIGLYLIKRK